MDISSLRHEVSISVDDQRRELQKGDQGPKLVVLRMEGGSDCKEFHSYEIKGPKVLCRG